MLRLVPMSVLLFTGSTNKNQLLQLIYPTNTVKMLDCVLVLDTLKAHKDQMSCELRTDSIFLKKY